MNRISEGRACWGVALALATLATGCGESEPIHTPKPVAELASGPPPLEPLGPGESSTADPGAVHEPGPPHESSPALPQEPGDLAAAFVQWVRLLDSDDADTRKRAADVIGNVDTQQLAILLAVLKRYEEEHNPERIDVALGLWLAANHEEALRVLVGALADEDRRVRDRVAGAFRRVGVDAAPRLKKALCSAKGMNRVVLAEVLWEIQRDESAIAAWADALEDPEKEVRWEAAVKLLETRAKAPAAVRALTDALEDPAPDIREVAAEALGLMGTAAKAAIPALLEAFHDEEGPVRIAAAEAVWEIDGDPAAISLLIDTLEFEFSVREEADRLLRQIGPGAKIAIPRLIQMLKHPRQLVRTSGADVLGYIGPDAKQAVPHLVAALEDPESHIEQPAIRALGRIGPDAAPAVPLILKALGSEQRVCIVALGGIGPAAKPAIPKLVQLFEEHFKGDFLAGADADDAWAKLDLRIEIVKAMARIDPKTAQKTALPSLIAQVKQGPRYIPPQGLCILDVQGTTIGTIGAMGPAAEPAVPFLIDILTGTADFGGDHTAAMFALKKIGLEEAAKLALPRLIEQIDDPQSQARKSAIELLGMFEAAGKPAVGALIDIFKDPKEPRGNRVAAGFALARIDPERASRAILPTLLEQLSDPDKIVRLVAAQNLAELGPHAKAALPALRQARAAPNQPQSVRVQIEQALQAIESPPPRRKPTVHVIR